MIRDRFLKNSLIMILSNLITGIFGFTFSIILSRKMGAEGMGLYGLVMPIYDLFICLICGGMITAISKVAAIYYSKNDFRNLNRSIDASILFDSVWSIIVICCVFVSASYISNYVIDDPRTIHAVQVFCPAMLFIALSSILKGYFYGVSDIKIPAVIDICEKFLRIVIFLTIVNALFLKKVSSTVTAAFVTLTLGEGISLILLYIFYKKKKLKLGISFNNKEDKLQLLFNIIIISFPLCINGFLSTGLSAISALIIPRRLVSSGIEYAVALSMIGKFKSMALCIVFFPITIVNSISTVLVPDLSEKLSRKDYWSIETRISQVIKIAFLLGITTLIICITIPNELGKLFFFRTDLGYYIKFACLCAPTTYTAVTTFAILNGLGKQNIILRNSLIVSLEELIILYTLTGISYINIYGCGISLILTSLTTLTLNLHEIRKSFNISLNLNELLVYILLGIFLYLILSILYILIPSFMFIFKVFSVIICAFLMCLVFAILVIKKIF
ncbi:stage V sporulation protein B [Clostridium sp. P21]|uniref:Multidrug-efflux transporter n=1 Tax=Clostridium muellerianum TaxID=2716538 RepID=A0A7Y0HNK8_9CLOT|nr:stage V sporulation protein B [Clostridium muellerianum]NMM62777.1 stage V sporulation protein B [Clostridium muellerianum]